jgi:putative transcriptional regulator
VENKLPQLRREYGFTQQQLADRVEVSRQTIIAIESGKFNPSVTLAFKLSHVFHRPIEDIFIYRGDEGK